MPAVSFGFLRLFIEYFYFYAVSILPYFESVNILPVAQEYAMEGRIISVDVGSKVLSDASFEVAKTSNDLMDTRV